MNRLLSLIQDLNKSLKEKDLLAPSISNKSVLWHVEHSTLVIKSIYQSLKESDPSDYRYTFTPIWLIVKWSKNIPRGKGKSPNHVVPQEKINIDQLNQRLKHIPTLLSEAEQLPFNSFFKHPVFGTLNKKQAFKFIYIHTLHHYKIIQDIIKNDSSICK